MEIDQRPDKQFRQGLIGPMMQQGAEKATSSFSCWLPCLFAQGMQVDSFYRVRVWVLSEVGLEGWLRWVAHSFGGVCAGILCSTLLLPLTPSFCFLLFNSGFGLFWSSCIFLSRICPNYVCMQLFFSSVQSLSPVWLFVTSWTAACLASLSITNSQSLLKLLSIESVMPSNHLILSRPLLLPPSIFPRVFSNEFVFSSGGQRIGISASVSVLPMNTQDWFP